MNRIEGSDEGFSLALLSRVAEQVFARHALVAMPTAEALHRLGFRPQDKGGVDLRWQARERRNSMLVGAGPGPYGRTWHLTGWYRVDGEWQHVDAVLADREPLGKVALALLDMWREAFGPAIRPPGPLDIGRIYEQRREKLGRLQLDPPRLELDGPAFRKVREQIRKRERGAGDSFARLSATHGMLRIETVCSVYGVPAQGGLGPECQVPVVDLLGIPDTCVRGSSIGLDRGWATLAVDWYCLRILNPSPPASDRASVYRSLLTGTFASGTAAGNGSSDGLNLHASPLERPGPPAAPDGDLGGMFDLTGCFFTTDRSDSAFTDRGPLQCPLSAGAQGRLARSGWSPDDAGMVPAAPLAGKFWWVRGSIARVYPGAVPGTSDDVQTTEDLFAAIARGYPAIVMDGPFDTKDDGHYALDVAWESPNA